MWSVWWRLVIFVLLLAEEPEIMPTMKTCCAFLYCLVLDWGWRALIKSLPSRFKIRTVASPRYAYTCLMLQFLSIGRKALFQLMQVYTVSIYPNICVYTCITSHMATYGIRECKLSVTIDTEVASLVCVLPSQLCRSTSLSDVHYNKHAWFSFNITDNIDSETRLKWKGQMSGFFRTPV